MVTNKHAFGWIPDTEDVVNDFRLTVPIQTSADLPPSVDWRGVCVPPVRDQGNLGSCTAFASTAAWRFAAMAQGLPDLEISELFTYYWSRYLMGQQYVGVDSGSTTTYALKSLAKYGAAPEIDWPYDIGKFKLPPPSGADHDALTHVVARYETVPHNEAAIKSVLASKRAIVFGMSVYESFESEACLASGEVPVPKKGEQLLGGHEMCLVGYRKDGALITLNSWGTQVGADGFFYLPPKLAYSRMVSNLKTIDLVAA